MATPFNESTGSVANNESSTDNAMDNANQNVTNSTITDESVNESGMDHTNQNAADSVLMDEDVNQYDSEFSSYGWTISSLNSDQICSDNTSSDVNFIDSSHMDDDAIPNAVAETVTIYDIMRCDSNYKLEYINKNWMFNPEVLDVEHLTECYENLSATDKSQATDLTECYENLSATDKSQATDTPSKNSEYKDADKELSEYYDCTSVACSSKTSDKSSKFSSKFQVSDADKNISVYYDRLSTKFRSPTIDKFSDSKALQENDIDNASQDVLCSIGTNSADVSATISVSTIEFPDSADDGNLDTTISSSDSWVTIEDKETNPESLDMVEAEKAFQLTISGMAKNKHAAGGMTSARSLTNLICMDFGWPMNCVYPKVEKALESAFLKGTIVKAESVSSEVPRYGIDDKNMQKCIKEYEKESNSSKAKLIKAVREELNEALGSEFAESK